LNIEGHARFKAAFDKPLTASELALFNEAAAKDITEALNNAIWEAAWFAVQRGADKEKFVATITRAASEAFDSHLQFAPARRQQKAKRT
jgi:hypothetical protein